MVAFGVLGGCLAMTLGLAGGLARGSARGGMTGAVAGLVLGGGLGAGSAALLVPIYQKRVAASVEDMNGDLAFPTLIQAGIWAALGVAAGAALGLGAGAGRRLPAVVVGGLVGGALGAVVYEVAASLLAPGSRTYGPIADTWAPRLLAATVVPILEMRGRGGLGGWSRPAADRTEEGVTGWLHRDATTARSLER